MEIIILLFLFLMFSSFFSYLFGSFLVVMLIFSIMASLFFFFSVNFIWFLITGLLIYLFGFIQKIIRWSKLPDISTYMQRYPRTHENIGVSCYNCGSRDLIHRGLFHRTSKYRFYICNSCGTVLYKFKVL